MQQAISPQKKEFRQQTMLIVKMLQGLLSNLKSEQNEEFQNLLKVSRYHLQFYIPQLCNKCIKGNVPGILKLLEEKAAESLEFFFLILWQINSYGIKQFQKDKSIDQIERNLEMKIVNKAVKEEDLQKMSLMSHEEIQKRLDALIVFVKGAIIRLHTLCLTVPLKSLKEEDRNQKLREYIKKANKILKFKRLKNSDVEVFNGVIVPFKSRSTMIVRLLETDFLTFNTKKRVPYMVIMETIDPREVSKCQQMEIQSETNLEEDFVDMKKEEMDLVLNFIAQTKMDANKDQMKKFLSQQRPSKIIGDLNIDQFNPKRKSIEQPQVQSIFQRMSDLEHNLRIKKRPSSQEKNQIENYSPTRKRSFQIKTIKQIIEQDEDENEDQLAEFGPWGAIWLEKAIQLRKNSVYGKLDSYKIRQIIIKGGDDLRQEILAMQIMSLCQKFFIAEGNDLYLKPYEIIVISQNAGVIEFIPNSLSVDGLKKKYPGRTLTDIYKGIFRKDFDKAQKNFIFSLAGYSLFCYILQIRDRHNGNILIDNMGHIIHIDFGFMFKLAPGNVTFEQAPFKLTREYVDLMGGQNSDLFLYYKSLLAKGFILIQENQQEIISLIQMMIENGDSVLPCLKKFSLAEFKQRLQDENNVNNKKYIQLYYFYEKLFPFIDKLVEQSFNNWTTIAYDRFQYQTNNIMP